LQVSVKNANRKRLRKNANPPKKRYIRTSLCFL